jgi:hypothetical protein
MKIHLPVFGPDLPVHPFTGLTALGLRRNGASIWPVRGGATDDDSGTGDDDDADDEGDADDQGDGKDEGDADDLRDPGKKALDTMKGQRNRARTDLRPWSALARELGVKTADEVRNLLKGKTKDGGDTPDPEQIRREERAKVEQETARDRLLDKIEAKASKFADPADAAALLLRENDADDFLDGTRIDADAVAEALEDLLERKPYLAAKTTRETRTPKTDKSQGT